jgi:hypothetical protein
MVVHSECIAHPGWVCWVVGDVNYTVACHHLAHQTPPLFHLLTPPNRTPHRTVHVPPFAPLQSHSPPAAERRAARSADALTCSDAMSRAHQRLVWPQQSFEPHSTLILHALASHSVHSADGTLPLASRSAVAHALTLCLCCVVCRSADIHLTRPVVT